MLVKHEFSAQCACPVDGEPDCYAVSVETDREIPVEMILGEAQKLAPEKLFQETFTVRLARGIGARVTTTGFHSGVKTTCSAG